MAWKRLLGRKARRESFFATEPLQKIRVDDIEIGYKVFGSGEPLFLIPGYIATMDIWDPLFLETLASRYRVVTFDNRGMGETSGGDAEWSIDRFAVDTVGLIETLGFASAHVLGWSLGGDVALSLAVNSPDRLSKLVLYAADCGGTEKIGPPDYHEVLKEHREVHAHFKRVLAALFPAEWMEAHPDYWRSFQWPGEITNPEHIIKQDRAYNEWPGVCDRLSSIEAPTLVVTGSDDESTPPENAVMLAHRIPDSWLVRFRGAGHGLMYQYPVALATVVIDFLEHSV